MKLRRGLLRLLVSTTYYPSLWACRAFCMIGRWNWWDEVDESIILGAVPSRADLERLHAIGVRRIVNLCEEFGGDTRRMAELGIIQLHIPTLDYFPPSETDLRRGVEFVRDGVARGQRVYMHCKAGRGRSATLAIACIMSMRGVGLADAFAIVQRGRKHIDRHLLRRPVLLQWERILSDMGPTGEPRSSVRADPSTGPI